MLPLADMRTLAGTLALLAGTVVLAAALWIFPDVWRRENSAEISLLQARTLYARCIEAHRSIGERHWRLVEEHFRYIGSEYNFDYQAQVYASPATSLRFITVGPVQIFPDAPSLQCYIDGGKNRVLSAVLWGEGDVVERFDAYESFDDWPDDQESREFYRRATAFPLELVAEGLSDPFSPLVLRRDEI